jgi:hypothetical protein
MLRGSEHERKKSTPAERIFAIPSEATREAALCRGKLVPKDGTIEQSA